MGEAKRRGTYEERRRNPRGLFGNHDHTERDQRKADRKAAAEAHKQFLAAAAKAELHMQMLKRAGKV